MAKIAVFLAEGFEEIEALTAVDLCRRAGIETQTVSVTDRREVTGSHGIPVIADVLLPELSFDEPDMLVLPGGMPGTKNLEACGPLMEQVRGFHEKERNIAAICAAPGILARAGILAGRRAVSYPGVEEALKEGGATPLAQETARDGHLLTSRGVGTAIPFALKIIEVFCGEDRAKEIAQSVVFRTTEGT